MQAAILLLLVCVPAPRPEPQAPAHPLVGVWSLSWGNIEQTTFFYADGACWSPEFGGGTWASGDDGAIWFSENGGATQYFMRVEFGAGSGCHVAASGEHGGCVEVRMRRGERLKVMPRVVE